MTFHDNISYGSEGPDTNSHQGQITQTRKAKVVILGRPDETCSSIKFHDYLMVKELWFRTKFDL